MAAMRNILPALALASGVAAQFGSVNPCSVTATTTIQSQADATALSSCPSFQGSIEIASGTTDSIDLSGIGVIYGDLIANNASSFALSGGSLSVITGTFGLNGLTNLNTLNFPLLHQVGTISWIALPEVTGLQFNTGVSMLNSLNIQNTGLGSLQGINLESAQSIMIVNNGNLKDITMQIANVTQSLVIGSNGQQLSVDFPNLIWANNITLRDCNELSTPSLSSINGSYGIYTSTFSSYSAPNLTDVGGALSFVSNSNLNNISLPELNNIGGALYVVSDANLASLSGFPALKTVGGNILGYGAFNNFSLPSLQIVKGSANVTSTQNFTDSCNQLQTLKSKGVIKGTLTCKSVTTSSSSSGSSGSGSSGSSGSGGKSAAPSLLIPGVSTVLLGVIGICFGLL